MVRRHHLNGEDIVATMRDDLGVVVDDRVDVHYVGHPDLRMIVPESRVHIELSPYYKRPVIWIMKPGLIEKEKKIIEASPLMEFSLILRVMPRG